MNRLEHANLAPRCSATSKRTGCPCRAPAMRGKRVCRFHGALGGAPKGKANGNWRSGRYTNEWLEMRRETMAVIRSARELIKG